MQVSQLDLASATRLLAMALHCRKYVIRVLSVRVTIQSVWSSLVAPTFVGSFFTSESFLPIHVHKPRSLGHEGVIIILATLIDAVRVGPFVWPFGIVRLLFQSTPH